MVKSKNINLTDLLVNTENYRFETVASQKEAIDQMMDNQSDKLFNLVEHIMENGLNPNDKIQVSISNHDKTKYNVLEGNRRVVALKILNNPDLVDNVNNKSLKNKFQKLHEKYKNEIIKAIECTIYNSPNEAEKWIKLKHAGQSNGIGTVDWNGQQVQRFEAKVEGKSSIALQTIKVLENSSSVTADLKKNINKLKITNLDRLISDPDVRNFLGVEVNNGVIQSFTSEKEVLKGLVQITKDLLNPNFKVSNIYTKDDRKDYIENFPKTKIPNINIKAKKPWTFSGSLTSTKPKPKSKTTHPKDRNKLIPKSCKITINKAIWPLQAMGPCTFPACCCCWGSAPDPGVFKALEVLRIIILLLINSKGRRNTPT